MEEDSKATDIGYNVSLASMTATGAVATISGVMAGMEGLLPVLMGTGMLLFAGFSAARDRIYFRKTETS